VSVGDVLRENAPGNERLTSVLRSGALVDDDIVNDAVMQSMQDRAREKDVVILDGYPRTAQQSSLIARWPIGLRPLFALQFDVPYAVCTIKLSGRRTCSICNKGINVNGVDTLGFNLPPMVPEAGSCKVNCNPEEDWDKREDDTTDTIKLRMEIYHRETTPVLKYWKERGQLLRYVPYNGVKDIDVLKSLVEARLHCL
jgi:adenylate kinase